MFRRSLVLWGACALLSAASFSQAAVFTAKWIGTRNGNWNEPANWDIKDSAGVSVPGKVPNKSGGDGIWP